MRLMKAHEVNKMTCLVLEKLEAASPEVASPSRAAAAVTASVRVC